MSESIADFEKKHHLDDEVMSKAIFEEFELVRSAIYELTEEEPLKLVTRLPAPKEGDSIIFFSMDRQVLPSSTITKYNLNEGIALDGPASDGKDVIIGRPIISSFSVVNDHVEYHSVDYFLTDPLTAMDLFRSAINRSSKIQIEAWTK